MPNKIVSAVNPKIKEIVRLKERKSKGLIVVEGHREISRALESGFVLKELFICRDYLKKEEQKEVLRKILLKNSPVVEVEAKVYDKISYGERQEGLLALFEPKHFSLESLKPTDKSLYLIIEEIEKPGNLGAILRTADAAGVNAVIVCDPKIDIFNPNVIRSSLGAIFTVKTISAKSEETLKFLRKNNFTICATTPGAKQIYTKANLLDRLAVVVGSEQKGLSDFWLNNADLKVSIPMNGQVDSLNVSTSTAVVLYEALRQRASG